MKKSLGILIVGLLIASLLAGCGGSSTQPTKPSEPAKPAEPPKQEETIKIGMVLGTTGKYAAGEAPLVNGAKMAVEEVNAAGGINGKKIELFIEDTGSEQTGAVNAYNRAAARKPVAILDTALSVFTLAQMPDIAKAGIPTLSAGQNELVTAQGNPWVFRVTTSDAVTPSAALKFVLEDLGKKKVAIFRVNDDFGAGWEKAIVEELKAKGMTPASVQVHGPEDKDMTPQLTKIKNSGADVMIVASHPNTHALCMKQRKMLGLNIPYVGSSVSVIPQTLELVSKAECEGVYATVACVPDKDPDQNIRDWAAKYKQKYGVDADYSAAEEYDAVMLIVDAIKAKGTSPEAIKAYLHSVNGKKGIGNYWDFDAKGDGGRQVTIVQVKDGAPEVVKAIRTEKK